MLASNFGTQHPLPSIPALNCFAILYWLDFRWRQERAII